MQALVDLQVAARLALREARRRLRGEREPAPDLPRFRDELDRALAAIPDAVAEPPGSSCPRASRPGATAESRCAPARRSASSRPAA